VGCGALSVQICSHTSRIKTIAAKTTARERAMLHREFEKAVAAYRATLDSYPHLQANFTAMFDKYGRIQID
jgi:hypothetical protein